MNAQVVNVDVSDRACQCVQVSVARDVDYELMPLAVVVAIVAVVWLNRIILVTIRILVRLIGASGPEFEDFLLERPGKSGIVGERRRNGFIRIFRPPVEIPLQVHSVAVDDREIVRLHPFRPGIPDLLPVAVAIAGRLQTVCRSRLLQRPWPSGDVCLGWRSILDPTNMVFIRLRSERSNEYCRKCNKNFDCYLQGVFLPIKRIRPGILRLPENGDTTYARLDESFMKLALRPLQCLRLSTVLNTHYAVLGIYSSSATARCRAATAFLRGPAGVLYDSSSLILKGASDDTLCAVFGLLITRASNFLDPAFVGDDGRQHSR